MSNIKYIGSEKIQSNKTAMCHKYDNGLYELQSYSTIVMWYKDGKFWRSENYQWPSATTWKHIRNFCEHVAPGSYHGADWWRSLTFEYPEDNVYYINNI